MKLLQFIKQNSILLSILLFGVLLRFYHIDFQSVWLDEIHTLNESNPNLSWIAFYNSLLASDPHPPLYFAFVRILFAVFGYKTIVLRLFSAILGVLGVYAIAILGKEMFNKKVGLIAAFLLSINYFHLYYSQEGRPYIFLVFFTILAFYRLIIFLKTPNRKNAIWHGVFAALMIYGHFFGLFVLFTHYLLMLFFLLLVEKQDRLKFFISLLLSGVVTLVLYLPSLGLFIKSMNITEFWIPAPTLDVYTLIIKEFFGNSELLFPIVGLVFLSYFIKLGKEKDFSISYRSIIENKTIFNFIVLITWIIIVLLIPLIRSYLSVPMLISRYFIVILPALILILAIGISQFQNKVFRTLILSLFFVFSMTDILVIKNYYHTIIKAQFRESTHFISQNNLNNTPVVSSLGWYMPFFLQNEDVHYTIIDSSLEDYIQEMQKDSIRIKPFWYIDGFGRDYKLTESSQNFMNTHFYIENNYDGFQAWTKHFILLKDVPQTLDLSKFGALHQYNGDSFLYNIEMFEIPNNMVKISGWAYFDQQAATNSVIDIVLLKEGEKIAERLQTQKVIRTDVTSYFKSDFDLSNSGFVVASSILNLIPGKYHLAIYLFNKETKKEGLVVTDKIVLI